MEMSRDPIKRRDEGLRRLSAITKGTLAGGLVLTGGLSAMAAHSFAGTAASSSAATTGTSVVESPAGTTATTPTTTATTAPYYSSQLSSPSSSVRSSSGRGRVRSGGS